MMTPSAIPPNDTTRADASRETGEFLRDFIKRNSVPLVDHEQIMTAITESIRADAHDSSQARETLLRATIADEAVRQDDGLDG